MEEEWQSRIGREVDILLTLVLTSTLLQALQPRKGSYQPISAAEEVLTFTLENECSVCVIPCFFTAPNLGQVE